MMDRKEAADLLDTLIGMVEDSHGADYDTALRMGIEAIQKYSTWSQTYSNMVEDAISRKAAVDVIHKYFAERIEQSPTHMTVDGEVYDLGICNPLLEDNKALSQAIKDLPSAQSERTCVNCGRTANNGGWYADGGTRCPIEEHYALPKDGYCHLWEKRNVADDDYPERREE